MYSTLRWTDAANRRNDILRRYEPLQPYLLVELAKHFGASVFLDIGANIGAYSLFFASLDGVKEVHSFEANPPTFEELRRNVALNPSQSEKIRCQPRALSSQEGTVEFGVVNDLSGANGVVETSLLDKTQRYARVVSVKASPLDAIFPAGERRRVCIKLDVEGHEGAVIEGAARFLRENDVLIQVEDHARRAAPVRDALRDLGFEPVTKVGPDGYFVNVPSAFAERDLITIFERASCNLVEETKVVRRAPRDAPLRLNANGMLTVELNGRLASIARQVRNRLR